MSEALCVFKMTDGQYLMSGIWNVYQTRKWRSGYHASTSNETPTDYTPCKPDIALKMWNEHECMMSIDVARIWTGSSTRKSRSGE